MVFSQKLASRYREPKHQAVDCVLLMQVGTVMQVMEEDARIVLYKLPGFESKLFSPNIRNSYFVHPVKGSYIDKPRGSK